MIISHKYKFIFIKNAKVGGSSFEKCIKPYLGNEDIIIDPSVKKSSNNLVSHDTIENVQKCLDPIVFQNYFKFCIERDPFEKVLSSYFFVLKKKFNTKNRNLKFILFMKPYYMQKSNFTFFTNYFRYSSNGKVLVDKILRFVNIL